MDLEKIGKFIAKMRQRNGFTQESLAEELDISNRAVSKWERGICLPEANNMAKLCELFHVSYSELLSGKELTKTTQEKQAEQLLAEFSQVETAQNKKFLMYENVIGGISGVASLALMLVGGFGEQMSEPLRAGLIGLGLAIILVGGSFCLKIETEAGKYECRHCGHRYVPRYSSVYFAQHIGRTRRMTCPKCGKKSWQKKVA